MRHRSHLRALYRHVDAKLSRFERRVLLLRLGRDDGGRPLDLHQLETELAAVVLNIQSYWSNWSRAYYLSTALGTMSISGAFFFSALELVSEHDALTVAITGRLRPQKPPPSVWPSSKEPQWFSPSDLSRAISDARVNTATTLGNYLNSAPIGLSHLRIVRNYYAHRNEPLWRNAVALGPSYLVGRARRPSDVLLFVEPTRTISVLERWILDIRRLASALCT